ncbi:MAG: hypothetical protein NC213_09775 [Acetobacter sp.]|nr:hypothetical protein [Bacteroides sp.]MCM1342020.1 hypothetical protein [Acetobacter sp.]MCM1434252.1 hypothetical protein [Clostridiales bacterium]
MKKLRIPIVVLCLCLLLSGCSFRFASIDDLISPISPGGENANIQKAVDDYCKTGYSLKIPSGGNYTTSFIFYDLDKDKQDEAIAFYEPSDAIGSVNMALIDKMGESWQVIDNVDGGGSDIISVDFCDVNNDDSAEILVCWSVISKSTNYNLSVYRQESSDNGIVLKTISDSISAGTFICADVNEDGVSEVVVFNVGSASSSPKAELYSFKNNSKNLIGETKLDSSINSFNSLKAGKTDQGVSIYADALRADRESMVTELIYWSDYYDSIVSPFYSYDTGKTVDTLRNNSITSRDIDNDEVIEIPIDAKKKLPSRIKAENWMYYSNTVLKHKCYSLSCESDRYIITIPDNLFSKISVKYDDKGRELTVLNGKQECFKIKAVISSDFNKSNFPEYAEIFRNSGFVYLANVNSKSNISIGIDDLKSMIKSY